MKVYRSGSERFHGWKLVIGERKPSIKWDEDTESVIVRAWHVPDANGKTSYDYDIHLNLEDLSLILNKIASDAISTVPDEVNKYFKGDLIPLIQLLTCASGSKPVPIPKVGNLADQA